MKNQIVIFGATSAIAHAAGRCFARDGASLVLVARNSERLEQVKDDLMTIGADEVHCFESDLAQMTKHRALIKSVLEKLPQLNMALIAYGTLGDQEKGEKDFKVAKQELTTNFVSVASLITRLANVFEKKQGGTLGVISSVAGDRGRKSNYIYGTAKGALSLFLQGVRNRLSEKGVKVVTIKPGFVDTPMTAEFKKGPLFASAEQVGKGVYEALKSGRDIVYLPWFWRYIMIVIKLIPEGVFKRLSI